MERTGLEPVTPTLPVLCAPNCANAPKTYRNIVKRKMPDCQEFFLLTSGISQNGGNIEKKHISKFFLRYITRLRQSVFSVLHNIRNKAS